MLRPYGSRASLLLSPIAMNSYLPPCTDPMQAVADIQKRLQGEGGALEQSSLYLDHAGAAAWYAVANAPAYLRRRMRAEVPG